MTPQVVVHTPPKAALEPNPPPEDRAVGATSGRVVDTAGAMPDRAMSMKLGAGAGKNANDGSPERDCRDVQVAAADRGLLQRRPHRREETRNVHRTARSGVMSSGSLSVVL